MAELVLSDFNSGLLAKAKALSAQIIDQSVTLVATDIDFTGAVLTVTGLDTDDTISVKDTGATAGLINVEGSDISYGTDVIATIDSVDNGQSGTMLKITFNSTATAEIVQAVIEHLALSSDGAQPATTRTLTVTLTDTLGNSTSAESEVLLGNDVTENAAPIVHEAIGDVTLERFGEFDFSVASNFTDADGDTLTFTIEKVGGGSAPSWLHFDNGHFYGQAPVTGAASVGSFIITAHDGLDSVSDTFSIALGGLVALAGSTNGDDNLVGDANANIGTLGDGDDDFTAGSGDDIVDGGLGNDSVTGGSGDDDLRGSQGVDILRGSDGNDTMDGGDGNDTLYGGNGNDILSGAGGSDTIRGDAGDDQLNGGSGNDRMSGGAGKDSLTGGTGADTFDFDLSTDIGKGSTRDIIKDFVHGTDKIDLSTMDASSGTSGNQSFKFIGAQNFHHKAGEVHYVRFDLAGTANDKTIVEGDVNGDAKADFQIELTGLKTLSSGDFIL